VVPLLEPELELAPEEPEPGPPEPDPPAGTLLLPQAARKTHSPAPTSTAPIHCFMP